MSLSLVFKALADPTRRRILQLLREGDLTAGEIAEHFAITKPSISHHLSLLKQAGLVSAERRGQNLYYALETTVFQEAMAWLLDCAGGGKDEGGRAGEREAESGRTEEKGGSAGGEE
ncbi:MAG: autorepressor SdpR family transcription factor [Bacillota bacterium]|nr:autorepressor SdpR family transcription factor [Bacillota bacterium]